MTQKRLFIGAHGSPSCAFRPQNVPGWQPWQFVPDTGSFQICDVLILVAGAGGFRTSVWRNQNPLPYHLATPQRVAGPKAPAKRATIVRGVGRRNCLAALLHLSFLASSAFRPLRASDEIGVAAAERTPTRSPFRAGRRCWQRSVGRRAAGLGDQGISPPIGAVAPRGSLRRVTNDDVRRPFPGDGEMQRTDALGAERIGGDRLDADVTGAPASSAA